MQRHRTASPARIRLAWLAATLWSACLLSGCTSLAEPTLSFEQRLAALPQSALDLQQPVTVRWNAQAVPLIEAQTDADAAFALGLVTEHLRGPQLQVLKRIAQGRLSEMGSVLATDIDHALRIIDFAHAVPDMVAQMQPATREWVQRFVDGLNAAQAARGRGTDERWLGITPEPWTVADMLTVGRLAGTDVNWLAYIELLRQRQEAGFSQQWRKLLDGGAADLTSFKAAGAQHHTLMRLLAELGRHGSNSVVVGPARSASGAALIANDPHLGQVLPNFWMLVGIKSPSFDVVGMMFPAVPIIALGRSPHLAWGGTNMRAASSDLVELTREQVANAEVRTVHIAQRGWLGTDRQVRWTPWGPILSDAGVLGLPQGSPSVALRWVGHRASDEVGAFLGAMKARNVAEFRQAMGGFAVSAQNLLVADTQGNIAHVLAANLPARQGFPADGPVLSPAEAQASQTGWAQLLNATTLPWGLNPAEGYLVSANNRPVADPPVGFSFSGDDRILRMHELLGGRDKLGSAQLKALQQDVTSPQARRLAHALAEQMRPLATDAAGTTLVETLAAWDGAYGPHDAAPSAFEQVLRHLLPRVYPTTEKGQVSRTNTQWPQLGRNLIADLSALPAAQRQAALHGALQASLADPLASRPWGELNQVKVQHLLGNVPVLGQRFVMERLQLGGSRETLMKNSHDLITAPGHTRYGSQSRHVSDLADIDANWFTLLGGQDGWLGSANFADQVPLWQRGEYLQLPLSPAARARLFTRLTVLRPAKP